MKKLAKLLTGVIFGAVALCSVATLAACEHEHVWSEDWTTDKEATCTVDGSKSHHCTLPGCEEKTDVTVIPAAHQWATEFTEDDAPTCTQPGSKSKHCTVEGCDGKTEVEEVPATDHTWATVFTTDKEPTCTQPGSKSKHCTVPGCDGKTEEEEIPANDHTWATVFTTDKEPTCTQPGSKSKHCTVPGCDGKTEVEEIPANGHNTTETPATNSTCSVKGHEAYWYCESCQLHFSDEACTTVISEPVERDLLDHTFEYSLSWHNQQAATCSEDGYKAYASCSVCGAKFTDSSLKTPITPEDWESKFVIKAAHKSIQTNAVKDPTCTAVGYTTAHYYCRTCKAYALDKAFTQPITAEEAAAFVTPALDHDWSTDWTRDKEPTCAAVGKQSHHCNRCSATQDSTDIAKLDHTWSTEYSVDTAATCSTVGSKSKHCTECGAIQDGSSVEIPVSADAHAWSTRWFMKTPSTCSAAGTQFKFCMLCGHESEITPLAINPTAHSFAKAWTVDVAPTCDTAGSKSHHCTLCDAKGDETVLPALGHNYNWTFDGLNGTATCTNGCNDTKTYTLPAVAEGKTVNNVVEASVAGGHSETYLGANFVAVTVQAHFLDFVANESGTYLFEFEYLASSSQMQFIDVFKGDTSVKTQATITYVTNYRSNIVSLEVPVYKGETLSLSLKANIANTPNYIFKTTLKQAIEDKSLSYGDNTVKITTVGDLTGVDSYTFTPTETKKYSITVPDGLTVVMNDKDLISAGTYANFEGTVNKAITFSFSHDAVGDYEIVIGEAYPQILELGKTVSVSLVGHTMLGYTVGDELAPGKYTLTFSGSFLFGRMTGCGKIWLQLNGLNDYDSLSEDSALFIEAGKTYDIPGYEINVTGNSWTVTLELAAGDVIYFAPESSVAAGSTISMPLSIAFAKAQN